MRQREGKNKNVRDCLEARRQGVETIKNNQAKFKEDLESVKQKLDSTTESQNVMSDSLNGELRGHGQSREVGKSEVNKLAANNNQAYERLQPLERHSRDLNL